LTALVHDEGRRRDLAAAGTAWVHAHRTWAANAEHYLRLYAELGAVATTSGGRSPGATVRGVSR
jgi:hypothetical protein